MSSIVPSPDSMLVSFADRTAAVPQRHGVPLPSVLSGIGFPIPLAAAATALTFLAIGNPFLTILWAVVAGLSAHFTLVESRSLRLLASRWSPAEAQAYRGLALRRIEAESTQRALLLLALGMGILFTGFVFWVDMPAASKANALALTTFFGGLLARFYGLCALPRDPDLGQLLPMAG